MGAEFYSPKVTGDGAALYVTFSSKDAAIFFKLIKQTGWNATTKKGSFQGGEIINVKFSADEAGDFIHAIRNKTSSNFYHSFGDDKCTGSLTYYYIEPKQEGAKAREGFGLRTNKNGVEYKVGFTNGAAERLMEYLKFALNHVFSAIYAADKKQAEEYLKAKEDKEKAAKAAASPKPKGKKSEPKPENTETQEGELEPEEALDF